MFVVAQLAVHLPIFGLIGGRKIVIILYPKRKSNDIRRKDVLSHYGIWTSRNRGSWRTVERKGTARYVGDANVHKRLGYGWWRKLTMNGIKECFSDWERGQPFAVVSIGYSVYW